MHKRLLFLIITSLLLVACSKDGGEKPPRICNTDIIGVWHCVRYVSDTTDIATSGLYYEFQADGSYVITKDNVANDNGSYTISCDDTWNTLILTPYYADKYSSNIYYRIYKLTSSELILQEETERATMYFEKIIPTTPR